MIILLGLSLIILLIAIGIYSFKGMNLTQEEIDMILSNMGYTEDK